MEPNRVLAIAVATGRIGYVFLIGRRLLDWGLSREATKTPEQAAEWAQRWINRLKPEVVVTEMIGDESPKGDPARENTAAVACTAAFNDLLDVQVPRVQHHANKYVEAAVFSERYPALRPYVPKRPSIWESEPRPMIYFEALALAEAALPEGNEDK